MKSTVQFLGQIRWIALPVNLFIAFALSAQIAVADPHPNMYLNQTEIDAIKVKVDNEVEPWFSAYGVVMSAAEAALTQPPLSVTFQGRTSPHYYTESPYCGWPDGCRDGQINPDADRKDYEAAIKLGDSVRDLGLAYAFTGKTKYADKAIELINVWSVNPETRMYPDAQGRIELFITLPGMFYGADLIWNYEGWNADEKTGFVNWVAKVGENARNRGAGANNFANWRLVLIASAAVLLDNDEYFSHVESEFKKLVSSQMNGAGSSRPGILGQEYDRAIGLHYSLYAINAMIQGAEIMRHRNINLYDYKDTQGRGLELALDFITPYAINPASWNADGYKQEKPITQRDSMALFELAYSHYQKQSYLDAILRWKRPMNEHRVMGINTLTHANRFELNVMPVTPSAPEIVTQPDAVTVEEGGDATFSVLATGSGTLSYQWLRNNVAIDDATSASYTITDAGLSDTGVFYRCMVSNSEDTVRSDAAELIVLADTTAPTLMSVTVISDTRIDIRFSEPVGTGSAENSANYQINLGIAVTAASLSSDGRTVSLTVSPLAADTVYSVSVSNVQDRANTPNIITGLSGKTFTYRIADDFEDGTAEGWSPLTSGRWRVVTDEGDMVYYLNGSDPGFDSLSGGRLGEYSLLSADYGDFTFTAEARLGDAVASNALADYAVLFGYQDSDNYYFVMFNNTQTATQLFKVVRGRRTELATADSDWLSDNAYHNIEVSRAGNSVTVRFDGNLILSANDDSPKVGKVGVGSLNDSAYFDDISVTGVALTISDNIAPVITLSGANPQEITVGDAYTELGATAMDDNVDISANIIIDASAVDTAKAGSYIVTYDVSDAAKNAAIQKVRTVNVVAVATGETNDSNEDGGGAGSFSVFLLLALFLTVLTIRFRLSEAALVRRVPMKANASE